VQVAEQEYGLKHALSQRSVDESAQRAEDEQGREHEESFRQLRADDESGREPRLLIGHGDDF
jgi:hypothetical protein